MSTESDFYSSLEEGVRIAVKALRDAGINTLSSCHHEGWIQCSSCDPTGERHTIWNVMYELGIKEWRATLFVSMNVGYDFWKIESESLKIKGDH